MVQESRISSYKKIYFTYPRVTSSGQLSLIISSRRIINILQYGSSVQLQSYRVTTFRDIFEIAGFSSRVKSFFTEFETGSESMITINYNPFLIVLKSLECSLPPSLAHLSSQILSQLCLIGYVFLFHTLVYISFEFYSNSEISLYLGEFNLVVKLGCNRYPSSRQVECCI